ncbi:MULTISPECIES: hypothetical protein [Bacteroides]|uniref:Uncharacterized protein n=1 Tax=Bacteroides caecimuris TaxID=1796613 RepID=A0A4S2D2U7_9BACE|nr:MULTISPECIES: hypothetical protein [Bacteroides]TGY35496.1 hypothetical protein E5353_09240 [Bacteroides caecimuris]
MTKLFDLLNNDSIKSITQKSIEIGNVYRIQMDKSNGITPKPGDTSRNKFFVVLGFDEEGNIYGGVIINSNINQRVPDSVKDWQMPIKQSKYKFLDYDSFVDCSKLKCTSIDKFGKWQFIGIILQEDIELIIGTIKESPNETPEHLALFGL